MICTFFVIEEVESASQAFLKAVSWTDWWLYTARSMIILIVLTTSDVIAYLLLRLVLKYFVLDRISYANKRYPEEEGCCIV